MGRHRSSSGYDRREAEGGPLFTQVKHRVGAIVGFIVTARRRSIGASLLFVPYAGWVAFATALNFTIWQMNN